MKKILIGFIKDGQSGGVDKYILDFCELFNGKYEIHILTNCANSKLFDNVKKKNMKLFLVSSLKNPIRQYRQIREILRKDDYEICYGNFSTALPIPLMIAAKKQNIPIRIVHSHATGIDTKKEIEKIGKYIFHLGCKKIITRTANRYFACSREAANWMFTSEVLENVKIFPNCIDLKKYKFDNDVRLEYRRKYLINNELVLGHISNFLPVKNTLFLLEILKDLIQQDIPVKLLLIGEGGEKEKLIETAKEQGIENNILDMGYQENVIPFYQVMDVFLLPSEFEGFSYVALEAQVTGLLCLVSEGVPHNARVSNKCFVNDIHRGSKSWSDCIIEHMSYDREKSNFSSDLEKYDIEYQKQNMSKYLERKMSK